MQKTLLLTLLLACGTAQAVEWVSLGKADDAHTEDFVDVSSIRVDGEVRRAWIKTIYVPYTERDRRDARKCWASALDLRDPTQPPQGTTPAQIAADFPAYIVYQFQLGEAGGMNAVIASMTDKELYLLASFFIANSGSQSTLQYLASQELDATNLVRWQAMFTQAIVNPYVGAYSPTPISTKYFAHPGLHAAVNGVPPSPPVPPDPFASFGTPIDMMYLEYRTNPVTGCSVVCAMSKVIAVLSGNLSVAWNVGTAIGTTFYNAMEAIDPSYGYDLVIGGGGVNWETITPPPASQGYVYIRIPIPTPMAMETWSRTQTRLTMGFRPTPIIIRHIPFSIPTATVCSSGQAACWISHANHRCNCVRSRCGARSRIVNGS